MFGVVRGSDEGGDCLIVDTRKITPSDAARLLEKHQYGPVSGKVKMVFLGIVIAGSLAYVLGGRKVVSMMRNGSIQNSEPTHIPVSKTFSE